MHAAAYHRLLALTLILAAGPAAAAADAPATIDWPAWRGVEAHGSLAPADWPDRLDDSTLRWKAPLPGKGCSTPIVWHGRIYVTAPIDGKDGLLAFDTQGRKLWEVTFGPEVPGKHRNGSGCNPSPVTDGHAVFVTYKSGTLAAVELDGRVRWQTNLVRLYGEVQLFWDPGTSPVLTRDDVVMARMHAGDSWLAAFDKQTGRLHWKVARNYKTPVEGDQSYTTPLVVERHGREWIIVYGAEHITVHRADTGEAVAEIGGFNPDGREFSPTVASPVLAGDVLVVADGRNDRRFPGFNGIRWSFTDTGPKLERLWRRTDIGTFVPTPAVHRGRVYLLRDRDEIVCLDPATGRTLSETALPRHRSNYYASPFVAGNRLYAIREDGAAFVLDVAADMKRLSQTGIEDRVIASPAPLTPRSLLVRGHEFLRCFGR
ncbi:MAG: Pyrrolo-quinoline quinone [Verrucomicrobia bacterium]|nr:MAG: Pyrrolo-quinoline quinone [Verrucomicrobiota bacterium]